MFRLNQYYKYFPYNQIQRYYDILKYFDEEFNFFSNYKKIDDKINNEKYRDLINITKHTLELSNWISNLKN